MMETRKEETTTLISSFNDFKGSVEEWRLAYFNLLSWKNTYGFPYIMDINADHNHDAYLKVVVDRDRGEMVKEYLEHLGYGEIDVYETMVQIVMTDWDVDCDDTVVE